MTQEDYYQLQAAKEFYNDAKYTHDVAMTALEERYTNKPTSLAPKDIAEKKRLEEKINKNVKIMESYMDEIKKVRDKYFNVK